MLVLYTFCFNFMPQLYIQNWVLTSVFAVLASTGWYPQLSKGKNSLFLLFLRWEKWWGQLLLDRHIIETVWITQWGIWIWTQFLEESRAECGSGTNLPGSHKECSVWLSYNFMISFCEWTWNIVYVWEIIKMLLWEEISLMWYSSSS